MSVKGSLKITCRVPVTVYCTTCTSDAILDMISPFLSLLKYPRCRSITLLNTAFLRFSKVWILRASMVRSEKYLKMLPKNTDVTITEQAKSKVLYTPYFTYTTDE